MRSRLAATLAIAILTAAAHGAKPRPGGSTPVESAAVSADSIYARLGNARSLFYSGKPEEALALLEDLANSDKLQICLEAKFLAGRCLWITDNEKDQKQAQKLWDQFSREMVDWKPGPVRLGIARALVLESAGDDAQAIRVLESAVARNVRSVCTPEAQVELARLLARVGRVEEARQQLASAEDLLNRETKVEMYKEEADPYYVAIQKARDGLKYDATPGLAEVEQADRLRAEKKLAEAGKLYEQIVAQWPKSESADRASVGIGHCLLALGKPAPAADLWRKFIVTAPAARWRGQAVIALLDMGMEGQLPWDETQKLAAWAESTLPTALAGEKAESEKRKAETGTSWQQAAYPLNLQIGAIAWMAGKYEPAGAALDQCIKLSDGDRAKRLASLAEVVRAKKSLLPEGVLLAGKTGQMDPANIVLSMSVIEALAEQYESSEHFATLVASGRLAGTPNQRGFATFLQICLDDTVGRVAPTASSPEISSPQSSNLRSSNSRASNPKSPPPLTIDQRYLQLTKAYPDASWLDEVIYRLAARNDKTAESATDTDPLKLKGGAAVSAQKPAPAEDLFTDNQIPPVLAAYRQLIDNYPKSPRRERALWRLGRICLDTGRGEQADQAFQTQCEAYPQGPYAGDALVRLIDVTLEDRFDLAGAKKLTDGAVQWAAVEHKPVADNATVEPWRTIGRLPNLPVADWVRYELYVRGAMVNCLCGDTAAAMRCIDAVGVEKASGRVGGGEDWRKVGLEYLRKAIADRKPITEPQALADAGNDTQRTAILLGDLYLGCMRPDRAEVTFKRLAESDPVFGKLTPGAEGYALLQLATALDRQPGKTQQALGWLKNLQDRRFDKTLWKPWGLLRSGVLTYNRTQDPKQANPFYQEMLQKYPNHPQADLAMVFLFDNLVRMHDWAYAMRVGQELQRRYPDNEWSEFVGKRLKQCDEALAKAGK